MLALIRPGQMGGGDIKLAGLTGLVLGWLGWPALIGGAALAFVLSAIVGLALLAARRITLQSAMSFGPFLIGGALLAALMSAPAPGQASLRPGRLRAPTTRVAVRRRQRQRGSKLPGSRGNDSAHSTQVPGCWPEPRAGNDLFKGTSFREERTQLGCLIVGYRLPRHEPRRHLWARRALRTSRRLSARRTVRTSRHLRAGRTLRTPRHLRGRRAP